ncbi:hypothetical protein SP19_81 [Salmonella phage 19]|nr:hypothetical protein SP19_81 [Salmonella phage 19]
MLLVMSTSAKTRVQVGGLADACFCDANLADGTLLKAALEPMVRQGYSLNRKLFSVNGLVWTP